MKRLLTIACVLFALAGAGQPGDKLYIDTLKPKTDTTPIIYLYCDTARRIRVIEEHGMLNNKLIIERDTFYYEPNYELRWDFGYEAREMEWVESYWESCEIPGSLVACVTLVPAHYRLKKHIGYLDRHKQPIRKVIIWQTKTIEK